MAVLRIRNHGIRVWTTGKGKSAVNGGLFLTPNRRVQLAVRKNRLHAAGARILSRVPRRFFFAPRELTGVFWVYDPDQTILL